jgi:hypothetical protein
MGGSVRDKQQQQSDSRELVWTSCNYVFERPRGGTGDSLAKAKKLALKVLARLPL